MHRMLISVAAGVLLCGPAAAQATTATLNAALDDCLIARKDGQAPQQAISTCEAGVAKLDAVFAAMGNEATPHLQNIYRFNRGFLFNQIGGAQADIDEVRSTRVCVSIEKSWAEVAKIDPAVSPESFQTRYNGVRESAVGATAKCREEKGTPPGAPPLR